jgi:diguanylate cyclase
MTVDSSGQILKVTASCGVSSAMPNEDVSGLIARADQGLYASKKAGRNCIHLHDGQQLIKHGAGGAAAAVEAKPAAEKSPDKVPTEPTNADPLQTLPNREAFTEEVRRRMEQHQKYHAPVTIVYGAVDGFTGLVAEHGREACNVILRAVAQFIKASLRETEMLARVADDRFAMVLGGVDAQEAMIKVERILHAIEKCRLPIDGLADVKFTASFGLAEVEAGNDTDKLMQRGTTAYASAAKSGNCAHIEIDSKCRKAEAVGV